MSAPVTESELGENMNILEKIYQDKKIEVRCCKKRMALDEICTLMKARPRKPEDFAGAIAAKIKNQETAIIAEVKKASPSKGVIREDFNHLQIARSYQENGATCISVLTDEKYFMGKPEYLKEIREAVNLPLLRKDFIVDPYQIYEAKMLGADCILLIMAMIDFKTAVKFEKIAQDIGLAVLAEVHDQAELELALELQTKLIGINNRNLKTMEIDLNTSRKLVKLIPQDKIVICESGINDREDVQDMKNCGINSFLIGESLMKKKDIGKALKNLL